MQRGFGHNQRGAVLPLVAISLAVLMGFAGMAVDVGYWRYQQQEQQSATDAAAVGGAQQLLYAGCPSAAAATTGAQLDASDNGYANGTQNVTVRVSNPPSSGNVYSGDSCAVSVQITKSNVPAFFTRVFGHPNGVTETTSATATLTANNSGCIYALSQTDELQLNGTSIVAPKCTILANSNLVQTNGGTVTVGGFNYAHSIQDNSTSFTEATPAPIPPVADPCPEIPGCAYLAKNPPPTTGCKTFQANGGSALAYPGCYSLFQVNGASVTMEPGLYVFTGTVQHNGGSITGSGVTMYLAGSAGPFQFNGSGDTFSPPSSGNYANVLVYQVPGNTNVVQFNGASQTISGVLYAPGALGQINGNNGQYVVLVFATMQFNGGTTLDLAGPSSGNSYIKNAVLVQ